MHLIQLPASHTPRDSLCQAFAVQAFNTERESDLIYCNDLRNFYNFFHMKPFLSMHVPSLRSTDDKLITNPLEKGKRL